MNTYRIRVLETDENYGYAYVQAENAKEALTMLKEQTGKWEDVEWFGEPDSVQTIPNEDELEFLDDMGDWEPSTWLDTPIENR